MTNEEIALQLTLKSLECNRIPMKKFYEHQIGQTNDVGAYNVQLVCETYLTALKILTENK